jgi:hypothetical protein
MTIRNYSVHLRGLSAPEGQISLRDIAELAGSLQLVATRIARQVLGTERPGRSPDVADRISEIRLTGLRGGSTTIDLVAGDPEMLPLIGDETDQFTRRFEDTLRGIATNRPPEWASPLVRKAVSKVVGHLRETGADTTSVEWIEDDTLVEQVMVIADLDDTVWEVAGERATESIVVSGRLDRVDLRSRRFRVRDDLGNDIMLDDVVDTVRAGHLIGERVVAAGVAEREAGRLVRVVEPTLQPELLPSEWSASVPDSPPLGGMAPRSGIPGVTSDEVEEFLKEIRT